jgi:DeoR family transcriptional regulator, suf operon transcriptional repressor
MPQTLFASSDSVVLDLLRQRDELTVAQLATELGVTATAVRQRLTRLMVQGLVERRVVKAVRGRPSHYYALTENGRRQTGDNFSDLAIALWDEVRAVRDPEVRRGLVQRVAHRMAEKYADQVTGDTVGERMEALADVYRERQIPLEVNHDAEQKSLPVLTAHACPYPDLAEKDRSVCAMERLMFAELLGANLRLSQCRLDGGACCTFE